jgi:hypothetical protein
VVERDPDPDRDAETDDLGGDGRDSFVRFAVGGVACDTVTEGDGAGDSVAEEADEGDLRTTPRSRRTSASLSELRRANSSSLAWSRQ